MEVMALIKKLIAPEYGICIPIKVIAQYCGYLKLFGEVENGSTSINIG